MNPIAKNEPLFEAAQIAPGPVPEGAAAEPVSLPPSRQGPPRFRHIERNQPTWTVVELERMLDESHPERSVWDFVGGLDLSLFEENVKARKGGAGLMEGFVRGRTACGEPRGCFIGRKIDVTPSSLVVSR